MKNFHLISAIYKGPTERRGSRVELYSYRMDEKITIPYNYEFNNACDIAEDYLVKHGHNVVGSGELKVGYMIVCEGSQGRFLSLKENKKLTEE